MFQQFTGRRPGCSKVQPIAYDGISSAHLMRPTPWDKRIPYNYSPDINFRHYQSAIIKPVAIYRGSDHQFGNMKKEDKVELANYMQNKLNEELRSRFDVVNEPLGDTLIVQVIITGAETNKAILAPFSRVDIAGGVYNAVQGVRGGEGTFTGSIVHAVEITDASTGKLLKAYVSKQYPNSLNIGASCGALKASKVGIDKSVDALLEQLK